MLIGQICEIELDCIFCTSFGGMYDYYSMWECYIDDFVNKLHILGAGKGKKVSGAK